jgi:phosphate transport system permease protein
MATPYPDLPSPIKNRSQLDKFSDISFIWLTRIFAYAVVALLILITLLVAIRALPAIQKYGIGFLISQDWNPPQDIYGVWPQIYGTIVSSLIGLLIAVPVGVGTAVLLSENFLPAKLRLILVFLVELLAAIPSVVYGIWGIFVLVPPLRSLGNAINASPLGALPLFNTPDQGPGMLPAGVILAIMTLPIITAISRDALISLPPSLRQAAMGLGATQWETICQILIPAAFSGIVSAVMLGLGRAMGETMAVTMLIGNSNNFSLSLLAPANTISSLLANQFAEANGLQVAALMYAALVLFCLTLIVNILAEYIVLRVKRL